MVKLLHLAIIIDY